MGNRLGSNDTAGQWRYNDNNELTGYDNVSFEYDSNGNMVKKTVEGVVTNYVYNTEDRLAEMRDGSGSLIASYYYDPFGRRLWKDVGGTRTYYHYADEGLVGEFDDTGAQIKAYGWKPGSTWGTDPLFIKIGAEYYFYHNDHLGTPQKMTAKSGAVVWSAKYSSFGEASVDASAKIENNLRFPGQYYDEETGLHYNWNRYYDLRIGRYLKTDPLVDVINLYAYARNDPINLIDPWGVWGVWAGTTGVASFATEGGNAGSGVAYDSDAGVGGYTTTGTTTGAGASVGYEAGFYTGSISGETEIATLGIGPVSIGFVTDYSRNWGLVAGWAWGGPAEGTISDNNTIFYPISNKDTSLCK